MLISNLPPGLKELAEKRRDERDIARFPTLVDHLYLAFGWGDKPNSHIEGYDYWLSIYEGDFSVYYGCKVVNCKPKDLRLEAGKTYLARNGRFVELQLNTDVENDAEYLEKYPFMDQDEVSYTAIGKFYADGRVSPFDLIKEVK